jgi:hypothetical protein
MWLQNKYNIGLLMVHIELTRRETGEKPILSLRFSTSSNKLYILSERPSLTL